MSRDGEGIGDGGSTSLVGGVGGEMGEPQRVIPHR